MSERAALDSYIETLQILARESDTDRTDAERDRDAAHRAKLLDAFAHELSDGIRQWAAVEVGGETEEIYGYAADLIDPESEDYLGAGPVRPGEEPTP